ncbi:DUF1801 domain-containing protein [Flavobacterium caeni]|uniref:YdhG-like domain-containing protein n=1 Tax=Flavobacterium caeni TaxID=490189 RepID=A0A1G5DWB2_9FLAO|nr:DUF1801 domain-containing protein [Flavobacterium caeni]SCY19039.1 protein of unknown function (DU1801) [Flavobacterium caeni]
MGKPAIIKTQQTNQSVDAFLDALPDAQQRQDSRTIVQIMANATGEPPRLWGTAMIGFGLLRYQSPKTGREVDWFKIGFSPRKANLSIHLADSVESHAAQLAQLGKHKTGKGCLYINQLADVDLAVLTEIIAAAAQKK